MVVLLDAAPPAFACACCTNEGQRDVATTALDSGRRQEIASLRFSGKATLFTGEGDAEGIQGIATPSGSYELTAKWLDDRLVFAFPDKIGRTCTGPPGHRVSVRGRSAQPPRPGSGATLYKEWKLSTPAAGSGVFRPGVAPRQILTLILQGGGNSCTSAVDFTHWTLVMQGPNANYSLFGDLVATK